MYIPENTKLFLVGPTAKEELEKAHADLLYVKGLLKKYNIKLDLSKKIYHLSEGQRKLLGLLSAFSIKKAHVLLVDEPTIGLDENGRLLLRELMQHAAKNGKTVLVTTNDDRFFPYFEKLMVLNDGKLVFFGKTIDVLWRLDEVDLYPNQIVQFLKILSQQGIITAKIATVEEFVNFWRNFQKNMENKLYVTDN